MKLTPYLFVFTLLLQACGSGVQDSNVDTRGIARVQQTMPPSLRRLVNNTMDLGAQLRIDGGTPISLNFDFQNNLIKGDSPKLPAKSYHFSLELFINDSKAVIILARANMNASIVSKQTKTISFDPFFYPDQDGDGYTNLAELTAQTGIHDPLDKPDSSILSSSENYILHDALGIDLFTGSIASQDASSSNYQDLIN
ncbi:MAG: hypothetical protein OEZ58_17085 [Gammaproteobacteria bacterium]|nr:hypothetical protein [Gammaproteobacteria bacterium]